MDLWKTLQEAWSPALGAQIGVLLFCLALAWALPWWLLRRRDAQLGVSTAAGEPPPESITLGRHGLDGALFPLLLLALVYVAQVVLAKLGLGGGLFKVAVPVLGALAVIRIGVKVLHAAYPKAPLVRLIEQTFSWVVWVGVLLWLTGVLPALMAELEQITWKVGGSKLSLRSVIEGLLTGGAVLILALWVSSAIESRLLRSATGSELSLRKVVANTTRALLMFVGLLLALSAVGIDLTALSVLGGAVGVGIGFGLQKLAANYVSGYVILAERSMRIGDTIRVDNFEGRITDIRARFTTIRALNGRESIVPNELLITQRVENLSLADPRVWQSTLVSVHYDSDVAQVTELLNKAALAEPRVLRDPAPAAMLSAFNADGLEFTLGYWISDPENGLLNLRSAINVRVLDALRQAQIEIPFPQRVVHVKADPGLAGSAPAKAAAQSAG